MEVSRHDEDDIGSYWTRDTALNATVNARYFVYQDSAAVIVQTVKYDPEEVWRIDLDDAKQNAAPLLDISHNYLSRLVLVYRHEVQVYDIESRSLVCVLPESTRSTTAVSWSPHDPDILAIGCLDGYANLINLKSPGHATTESTQIVGPIRSIAWSADPDGMLALSSCEQLCVWRLGSIPQLVASFERRDDVTGHLEWHPRHTRTLLSATDAGEVVVWDFTQTTKKLPVAARGLYNSRRYTRAESDILPSLSMTSQRRLFAGVKSLVWSGAQTVVVLYSGGKHVARLDVRSSRFGTTDWSTDLETPATKLLIRDRYDHDPELTAISPGKTTKVDVQVDLQEPKTPHSPALAARVQNEPENTNVGDDSALGSKMIRMPITAMRRLGRKLPHPTSPRTYSPAIHATKRRSLLEHYDQQVVSPISQGDSKVGIAALLQSPQLDVEQTESPMPFLSPAIPARTPLLKVESMVDMLAADLTKAHPESYFGSFSSANAQDSDSDDDGYDISQTKVDTTRLPGGFHVPLPRSCGAVFGSSGALVTFGPPSTKAKAAKAEFLLGEAAKERDINQGSGAYFPRFGNLLVDLTQASRVSGTAGDDDSNARKDNLMEMLGLDRASGESNQAWQPLSFPNTTATLSSTSLAAVSVTVKTLDAVQIPAESNPQYLILVDGSSRGLTLCAHNVEIALANNRTDDAMLWSLLGRIINMHALQKVMLEPPLNNNDRDKVTWADHPLGSKWLVRRLFLHAESAANIRMLACMAMVLVGSCLQSTESSLGPLRKMLVGSTPKVPKAIQSVAVLTTEESRTPMLALERVDSQVLEDSPIKQQLNSSLMSLTNTSQPTTPRLESSSSTPPWSFTGLPQSNMRSSLSGSASPETTRSSFSAAVKSYAQSVSDKFGGVYSTSPPIKRGGLSPSNELSSSLPSAGGSWSKTVSFASNAKSSGLGRSPVDLDGGYESDRTVEDNPASRPVPSPKVAIKLVWKNEQAFTDDGLGAAQVPLIPKDMLGACAVWCTTYADRLRSSRQDVEAVQFEKIAATLATMATISLATHDDTRPPSPKAMQAVTCSICSCIVKGLEQVCLSCQHACHLACLESLFGRAEQQSFQCPYGCGCQCTLDFKHS